MSITREDVPETLTSRVRRVLLLPFLPLLCALAVLCWVLLMLSEIAGEGENKNEN